MLGIPRRRGHSLSLEVISYLGGQPLGRPPIVLDSWQLSGSSDARNLGELSFSVPALPAWVPLRPTDPLARYGQTVQAFIRWGDYRIGAGRYRLVDVDVADGEIKVTAKSCMYDLERARFLQPVSLKGSRKGAISRLLSGVVPYRIDPALADATMSSLVCEESRLDSLLEVVESWPARVALSVTGGLVVAAPLPAPTAPVARLSHGDGLLTVAKAAGAREPYNAVVVTAQPSGADPVTAWWTETTGPLRWGGPYGQNPRFHTSPLLPRNKTQLRAVAANMGVRERRISLTYQAGIVPDPRLEIGDTVAINPLRGTPIIGRISAFALTSTAHTVDVVAQEAWL